MTYHRILNTLRGFARAVPKTPIAGPLETSATTPRDVSPGPSAGDGVTSRWTGTEAAERYWRSLTAAREAGSEVVPDAGPLAGDWLHRNAALHGYHYSWSRTV